MAENLTRPNISIDGMLRNKKGNESEERESTFDAKNYLDVRLDKSKHEKKKVKRIRLLPSTAENDNPFTDIHQHNVRVPVTVAESGWKNYICLKHTDIDHSVYGNKCPFCEINSQAYKNAQLESDPIKKKKWIDLSCANHEKLGKICRCIDMDFPEEGVKFWKFNVSTKENDPFSQIYNLWENALKQKDVNGNPINILDLYTGYDLIVTISEGGENTKGNTITITTALAPSPISNDQAQIDAWVNDEKKWWDVFKIKPYDYMSVISIGETPWFDNKEKVWVPKKSIDALNEEKRNEAQENIQRADQSFRQEPTTDFISSLELPDTEPSF